MTSGASLPPPPPPAVGPDGLPFADWYQPMGGTLVDAVLREPTCVVCGAQPAVAVKLRRVVSYVVWFRWRSERHVLCRSCGQAAGRSAQNRTALAGWWGPFAFVATLVALMLNCVALRRLARLAPPHGALRPSATPGRPVLLRSGALVGAAVLGVVAYSAATFEVVGFEVGSCVTIDGDDVRPVPCGGDVDGEIVAVVPSPGDACPGLADVIVLIPASRNVACVDTAI